MSDDNKLQEKEEELRRRGLSDQENHPYFKSDPNNTLWFSAGTGTGGISSCTGSPNCTQEGDVEGKAGFFRDIVLRHRRQWGPSCVSNVLATLAGRTNDPRCPSRPAAARNILPRDFQKPDHDVNTNDPVTWSKALMDYGMKLAYCTTDCRRLKHYLKELVELDDLFTISYYCVFDKSKEIVREPDASGKIVGSHIVIMHRNMIYDSCSDKAIPFDEFYGGQFGDVYVKRIFRVVPSDYYRGLYSPPIVTLPSQLPLPVDSTVLAEKSVNVDHNSSPSTTSPSLTLPPLPPDRDHSNITTTAASGGVGGSSEVTVAEVVLSEEASEDDNHPEFKSDSNARLWQHSLDASYYRDISLAARRQIGPSCVSNVLATLTNRIPRDFQKPLHDVNTQEPVSWSCALIKYGMKLAFCAHDCRRLKHYLPELLALDDLFTISFYTGNKLSQRQAALHPKEILKDPASCPRGHDLLKCSQLTSSWKCDARKEPEGCKCDNQTAGKDRYRCEKCNFDYCGPCYDSKMEKGEIIGAHIVILHNEYDPVHSKKVPKIFDSAKGASIPIDKYDWKGNELGDLFVKRIFRVVPADHPIGL